MCPGITIKKLGGVCKVKEERVVRVLDGMTGSASFGVHNPSLKNLARGVAERVLYTSVDGELVRPIQPEDKAFDSLHEIRDDVLKCTVPTSVVNLEDFPSLYKDARKRSIYERAVLSLSHTALTIRDATVSVFVKAEKVNFSAKPDPAPRVIQPRSPRYNACLGRFLKPFEKAMFYGFKVAMGYTVILKGLNAITAAETLRENWDAFVDPVAIGLDASRFDQHVSREALEFEHTFYNRIFKNPELKKLLTWQLNNSGVGYAGGCRLKYKVRGCRMSGDINTSLGNCIIMCCIVLAFFKEVGVNARLSNNGDDCVVFCERKHMHRLSGIGAWFKKFGFKLTEEEPVYDFEKIVFCQTQPVNTIDGWRMVRDPRTALSKDMVSLLPWDKLVEFDRWRGAISSCGKALTNGVPFWYSFYSKLGGVVHSETVSSFRRTGLGYMSRGVAFSSRSEITPEARYSFWLAFGVLPDEQIVLENIDREIQFEKNYPLMFGDITSYSQLL